MRTNEMKSHVKLYKAGKLWLAMMISTGIVGGVMVLPSLTPTHTVFAAVDSAASQDDASAGANGSANKDAANTAATTDNGQSQNVNANGHDQPNNATMTNTPVAKANDGQSNNVEKQGQTGSNQAQAVDQDDGNTNTADNSAQDATSVTANNGQDTAGAAQAPGSNPTANANVSDHSAAGRVTAAMADPSAPTPIVGTKDSNGNVSVDPDHTGKGATTVTGVNADNYFTARRQNTTITPPIDANGTVQLTDGHDPSVEQSPIYAGGLGFLTANQQINFTSDFALKATINIKYDKTMSDWVGGDGTSLFFEPMSAEDVVNNGWTGGYLGLDVNVPDALSFNISANALGIVGNGAYPSTHWLLYQAGVNALAPNSAVIDVGALGDSGNLTYTFDMTYDAATQTVITKAEDVNGNVLDTWSYVVPGSWIGNDYTLGVSGAIAASHASYYATIDQYSYTPVKSSLNIDSTGLPANVSKPDQTGVRAMAGNVIAFYPAGTVAPATNANGQAVTSAYAVNDIGDYYLASPQFITIGGGQNTISLAYKEKSSIGVNYVDENGNVIHPATAVKGKPGDAYQVAPLPIDGYQYQTIAAGSTLPDGTFTDATGQSVTFVYAREDAGGVTIHYVDDHGNTIAANVVKSGYVGDKYAATPDAIAGYTYQGIGADSSPLNGTMTANAQTVTLVYTANPGQPGDVLTSGGLTIKYVDDHGHAIAPDETKAGYVGNGYRITPDAIAGYTYQGLGSDSAPLDGQFNEQAQTITLVYVKTAAGQSGSSTPTKPGQSTNAGGPTTSSRPTLPNTGNMTLAANNSQNSGRFTPQSGFAQIPATQGQSNANRLPSTGAQVSLPATGDEAKSGLSVVGLLLMGLTALMGLGHKRRVR